MFFLSPTARKFEENSNFLATHFNCIIRGRTVKKEESHLAQDRQASVNYYFCQFFFLLMMMVSVCIYLECLKFHKARVIGLKITTSRKNTKLCPLIVIPTHSDKHWLVRGSDTFDSWIGITTVSAILRTN